MKFLFVLLPLCMLTGSLQAGDIDDNISDTAGFGITNKELQINKNHSFTRMKVRAKIERAKRDDSIMLIDDCTGAGNVNVVGNKYIREIINNSNNSGTVSTCNKK